MTPASSRVPRRVLVYHIGSLGDTLMALPALWAVRAAWPEARLSLLTKRTPQRHVVVADSLLAGTQLFDEVLEYAGPRVGALPWSQALRQFALLLRLRRRRFDTLVYLAPSERQASQVERDRRFFAAAGMARQIGTEGFQRPPPRSTRPLPVLPTEAEALLRRLAAAGLPVPAPQQLRRDCAVGPEDEAAVQAWLQRQATPGPARNWLAIAPGSNMPSKIWPLERFVEVARALHRDHGLWPVVFGGPEDREAAGRLLAGLGAGWTAAGELSVRAAAAAMRRCSLYLGNDTGTMHLAASEGVRCVVPFAARDYPGKWLPLGTGHQIIRREPECEGCMLERCEERRMACLTDISTAEVLAAARRALPAAAAETRA